MFDIGWSEFVLIAVVALIAIGPKELPGVLRMIGQWMGKVRRMAAEFQGQFQEAMREAEMADLKKSFDEVKEAATGFADGGIMTSLEKDVSSALRIEDVDKPATPNDAAATSSNAPATSSDAPEVAIPETFTDVDAKTLEAQPLAITQEIQPQPTPQGAASPTPDALKDAKAS